jgi:hypothetical protein
MQLIPSDVASGYFASDTSGGAATSLQASGQGSSTSYQHQTADIGYPGSMSELQQSGGTNPGLSESRDPDGAVALKWSNYHRQLGTVFRDVTDGQLERASGILLELSRWLLPQVTQLGTDHADHTMNCF